MRQIYVWHDFKRDGIEALTGEACAYSMRLLCDLNEDGAALMQEFLGVQITAKPWNSRVNGKPAVASIMLPKGMLKDLAKYTLFREGYEVIKISKHVTVTGMTTEEALEYGNDKNYDVYHNPMAHSSAPMANGRNVHMATGRTE